MTMARMTKKDTEVLRDVLRDISDTLEFIHSDRTAVCVEGGLTTDTYVNKDGRRLVAIEKRAGSPIQYAEQAASALAHLITTRGWQR